MTIENNRNSNKIKILITHLSNMKYGENVLNCYENLNAKNHTGLKISLIVFI